MDNFIKKHQNQLDFLNIPDAFFTSIMEQLEHAYVEENGTLKHDSLIAAGKANLLGLTSSDLGAMVAIPHLCSWDMLEASNTGLWDALSGLSLSVLQEVYNGLKKLWKEPISEKVLDNKDSLLDFICGPRIWSRVILYKRGDRIRGALPTPPFLLQVDLSSEIDGTEADLSGPFPFQYHTPSGTTVDCSLAYLNPNKTFQDDEVPTIDFCPPYSVGDATIRCIRYAALLGTDAPTFAIDKVKEINASFVHSMHLVRQQMLEKATPTLTQQYTDAATTTDEKAENSFLAASSHAAAEEKIWKVYTDSNDPLELAHPKHGLSSCLFNLVDNPNDADIIYSYSSIFAPGPLNEVWKKKQEDILINQFPYEGAFVQKDHLGREILRQHGLPRPNWAIETYDLDVQLGEFVGAAMLELEKTIAEGSSPPLWIIKPAKGTQSQGHVVTRSISQVLRLVDSGGVSRVAQRYIENPVCYKGRKLDCRSLVMMTSAANGVPTLYMYNRMYFRIAGKQHAIATSSDLMDHQSVLSAMHLVKQKQPLLLQGSVGSNKAPTTSESESLLPIDTSTIAQLESDYGEMGFEWKRLILPKITTLIKEMFSGMARAYPAMGGSDRYRALYGVDTMFDIGVDGIEPKLTEVSFCPSNNAICDAYEQDVVNYKDYTTDVFKCLFLGEISPNMIKL